MKSWLGTLQVLAAGAGFGFLGVFGRWAFAEGFSVGELLFWRFVFSAALLWTYVLLFKRSLLQIRPLQVIVSCLLGIFGYAVFSTLYFESIKGISVALAAMLLFTFPIFVSIGAHFILRERMNRNQWLALTTACVGLIILLWGDMSVHSLQAVMAGLSASITYSIYVLISGRLQKNVEPLSSSLFVISSAAIGLYLFHQPDLEKVLNFTPYQGLLIIGIALVGSILPMTLFLAGLQKMPSSRASLLVMIEPVVAALAAWLLLNETLSTRQILGSFLVLGAIAFQSAMTHPK